MRKIILSICYPTKPWIEIHCDSFDVDATHVTTWDPKMQSWEHENAPLFVRFKEIPDE